MNTFIATIIASATSITVALIAGLFSNRKINTSMEVHDVQNSKEHGALSKEHDWLSNIIAVSNKQVESQITGVAATTTFLKEEQLKETARVSALKEQQQALQQSAANIGEFSKAFIQLASENQALTRENQQQRADIAALKMRIQELQRQCPSRSHDDRER